ncbi:hypothetical protein VPNG_05163 [Cytospora leucostoma]|uniref:Uncharacterized protein n=1 Tax=Cytospora leucostoma TaxID=1230097 RepID=A0A423X434_9PEZI|nr:hypothetical protein VPNG_05163 [Cytospora leucostoma]
MQSLAPLATMSRAARRALHNRIAQRRRRYMAIPTPPLPYTLERKLRATIVDGPEAERYPERVPHQDEQAAVVLSPPPHNLLLEGQTQGRKRLNTMAQARNGNFFTISMEPQEWKDPLEGSHKKKCSIANIFTATTTIRESSQEDSRGNTAAEAAGHYRNGACFAAWPVGENGGEWRSVRARTSGW